MLLSCQRASGVRVNPRLMERGGNLVKMTNYENFKPFKRSYTIERKIPTTELLDPERYGNSVVAVGK